MILFHLMNCLYDCCVWFRFFELGFLVYDSKLYTTYMI